MEEHTLKKAHLSAPQLGNKPILGTSRTPSPTNKLT